MRTFSILLPSLVATAAVLLSPNGNSARAQQLASYCPGPTPPANVLLVDQTEVYDRTDQQRFASGMNRFFASLRPGHVLEIYPIKRSASTLAPIFSLCVPGCADEIEPDKTNWNTVCSTLRAQRDKKSFQGAFVRTLREIVRGTETADGTAILGTLEQLDVQYHDGQIANLTIFSDMLEFTPRQFRANNPFKVITLNDFDNKKAEVLLKRASKPLRNLPAFKNTSVLIFGIGKRLGREVLLQDPNRTASKVELPQAAARAFRTFWEKLFTTVLGVPKERLVMTLNY